MSVESNEASAGLEAYRLPQSDSALVLNAELQYLDGMPMEARCLYFTYLGICDSEELEPMNPIRWYIDHLSAHSHSDVNPLDDIMAAQLSTINASLRAFFMRNDGIN